MEIPPWTQTELPTPQLCELRSHLPEGENWRYEIKWDGYRSLLIANGESGRFVSRNGKPLAENDLATQLAVDIGIPVILDGELVVFDEDGKTSFRMLRVALGKRSPHVRFVVFDILRLDDLDLRSLELRQRLEFLEGALTGSLSERIMVSPRVEGSPKPILAEAFSAGLEGIVAKDVSSRYEGRRSSNWIKVKCRYAEQGLVIGYTLSANSERSIGALVIGDKQGGKIRHIGRVGTGFTAAQRQEWFRRLEPARIERHEVENLTTADRKGVHWVRPEIVVEFEVAERTNKGLLRQASFVGEKR